MPQNADSLTETSLRHELFATRTKLQLCHELAANPPPNFQRCRESLFQFTSRLSDLPQTSLSNLGCGITPVLSCAASLHDR